MDDTDLRFFDVLGVKIVKEEDKYVFLLGHSVGRSLASSLEDARKEIFSPILKDFDWHVIQLSWQGYKIEVTVNGFDRHVVVEKEEMTQVIDFGVDCCYAIRKAVVMLAERKTNAPDQS